MRRRISPASPRRSRRFGLQRRGFRRRHRRHGDGRRARTSALRTGRRSTSIAIGSPRAVGRLSVRIFGLRRRARRARSLTISAARSSSPTSCATSTRTRASAGSICRAKRSAAAGIDDGRSATVARRPEARGACVAVAARAREHFEKADAIMARGAAAAVKAPRLMARRLWLDPRQDDERGLRAAARRARERQAASALARSCATASSERRAPSMSSAPGSPGSERGRAPGRRRARRSSCMRRRRSPAAAAGPISTRRSASSSTTATICCCRAITRRSTISTASARARRCTVPARPVFDFADLEERRALAARPNDGPHPLVAVRREKAACRARRFANISRRSACS